MINPWLEIPSSDYENHMNEIGQAQVLSQLINGALNKYKPRQFALLGCATGNGLEHVDTKITEQVHAIDINPDFLALTKKNYNHAGSSFSAHCVDIQNEELSIRNINLFFVGLVLEYVQPLLALQHIIRTISNSGILTIVIQKNRQTTIVSKTRYTSLRKLNSISNEVSEKEIHDFLISECWCRESRKEIELSAVKSFVVLEYKNAAV